MSLPTVQPGQPGGSTASMASLMRIADVCAVDPGCSDASGAVDLADLVVTSVTQDSRKVKPGSCFVALCGARVDGHAYVDRAVQGGARVVVAERAVAVPDGVAFVRVTDSHAALARLSAAFYGLAPTCASPLTLVGITGTNGKTTVAWLMRSILSCAGYKAGLFGTIEYDLLAERVPAPLTTPDPVTLCDYLARARAGGASHAVMEVSSHALSQRRCDGLEFAAGVFTNLSGDHLDYHGTMSAYASAKRRLFDSLGDQAVAVVNADDPASSSMVASTCARIWRYGIEASDVEIRAEVRSMARTGSCFDLHTPVGRVSLKTGMMGRHNVVNALAAAATGVAMGLPLEAIQAGIGQLGCVPGRLERTEPAGCGWSAFVDYAHTDDAMVHALSALRR